MKSVTAITATKARFKVLWLLFALTIITYLDRLCIAAAAPAITETFHFSPSQMGYVFSAFTLAYALFEVPSGWLADRFGARLMLTRIVVWWSAMTAATSLATGFASQYFDHVATAELSGLRRQTAAVQDRVPGSFQFLNDAAPLRSDAGRAESVSLLRFVFSIDTRPDLSAFGWTSSTAPGSGRDGLTVPAHVVRPFTLLLEEARTSTASARRGSPRSIEMCSEAGGCPHRRPISVQ